MPHHDMLPIELASVAPPASVVAVWDSLDSAL